MHTPNLIIDEQLLDELVSGSLSKEQYRQVLLALEANPAKWRDCALAFLQEQALEEDLAGLAKYDSVLSDQLSALNASEVDTKLATCAASPTVAIGQGEATSGGLAGSQSHVHGRSWRWLAAAAMLLLGFTCGWWGAGVASDDGRRAAVDTRGDNSLAGPVVDVEQSSLRSPLASAGAMDSQSSTSDEQTAQAEAVHLISSQLLPAKSGVPAELRELERLGRIQLETFDSVMPVDLQNGESVWVPVQQYRIVPTAFSY